MEVNKTTVIVINTDQPKLSDANIKKSFRSFLSQPAHYRKKFTQQHFDKAFDGYSYLGQEDSTNQYATDLLHSFVLSRFSSPELFPSEFHAFLTDEWEDTIAKVRMLERQVLEKLELPEVTQVYETHVDHMISCNYYPPTDVLPSNDKRLSSHKDISLFSVFVYGIDEGLSYVQKGLGSIRLGTKHSAILFPGYFLEYLSAGKYPALDHQVDLPQTNEERFSFAFFSIPRPEATFQVNGNSVTSSQYYQEYLSLF
ncbi:MAG: isopenicillin N synthase-like dioxygenase [Cyclobacteriaceae bacterium]